MKIVKLHEDRVEFPVCGQLLSKETRQHYAGWKANGYEAHSDTCTHAAKYKIGERYFCGKHAGVFLLKNFDKIEVKL